jgi:hypothetical protein
MSTYMRSGISGAVGVIGVRAGNTDVAILAPAGRPTVADQPVLLALVLTITNQHDGVVDIDVGSGVAALEDTRAVRSPVSIDGDSNRANSGDGVHEGGVVVLGQLDESTNRSLGSTSGGVASVGLATVASVTQLVLLVETLRASQVVECDLGSGSSAATSATA